MFEFDLSKDSGQLEKSLMKLSKRDMRSIIAKYGPIGVKALSGATPIETGDTASSWKYEVVKEGRSYSLEWHNTNVNNGVNIAVIIQLGHGTGTGGYVRGIDYINPAMKPVFDKIADDLWREVTS